MPHQLSTRLAQATDHREWHRLWRGYCDALNTVVPDEATSGTWQRIVAPKEPISALLVFGAAPEPCGFANFVLHPHTWSMQTVCYLEDLYVASEARGSGAARALIQGLVDMGRQEGWRRVYWHTHEENYRARALYDRFAKRTDYVRYDIPL